MRIYAPHNASMWSAMTTNGVSGAAPRKAFAAARDALRAQIFGRGEAPVGIDPRWNADVRAAPRLAALHRWLGLSAPLGEQERDALRSLMRPGGVIVRENGGEACRECGRARREVYVGVGFWGVVARVLFWVVFLVMAVVRRVQGLRDRVMAAAAVQVKKQALLRVMANAGSYSEWHTAALALDEVEGNAAWKTCDEAEPLPGDSCAKCQVEGAVVDDRVTGACDLDMIRARLSELAVLYKEGDVRRLAFALRASLQRNLGGMCNPELHAHSRVGTKRVVEDYNDVVSYLLAYIAHSSDTGGGAAQQTSSGSPSVSLQMPGSPLRGVSRPGGAGLHKDGGGASAGGDAGTSGSTKLAMGGMTNSGSVEHANADGGDSTLLSVDDKLTFFNETRHAYGRTALMLSGGASMGINHLGVVKALLDQGMMPKVVCGTSAGALVGSIVGIFNDTELQSIMQSDDFINPLTQQPFSFRYFDEHVSFSRRLRRFLRKGFIHDVRMLQDCLRRNYGDITFEEAYLRTRRILNITVCPMRSSADPPLLLNYLTAPHVLVWSAASASSALPLVFAPVELVAKSALGRLIPYQPDGMRWIDGSITSDLPLARIGELFNVTNFLVSQTNPHVIPRRMPIFNTRLAMLIKSEFQFRYWQALQLELVPKFMASIFPHLMQPYEGSVTIMPDVSLSDVFRLLQNPTPESIRECIRRGEVATFPFIDRIRLHCLIEQTLDQCVEHVARTAKRAESRHPASPKPGRSLFGRVPSWLWIDTNSVLSSTAVTAVTSRFGRKPDNDAGSVESVASEVDDDPIETEAGVLWRHNRSSSQPYRRPSVLSGAGASGTTVPRATAAAGTSVPRKTGADSAASISLESDDVGPELDEILNDISRERHAPAEPADSRLVAPLADDDSSDDCDVCSLDSERVMC